MANGVRPDETVWLPEDYEVFGFVFCVAFDKQSVSSNKPLAYFRVRTIIKQIGKAAYGGLIPVLVETDNIAYADLKTAMSSSPRTDCLKFIDPATEMAKKNKIDSEVIVKPSAVTPTNPFNADIPASFKGTKSKNNTNSIIENEGSIFGKKGIWDALLSNTGKYGFKKGTLVALTWNKTTKHISFDFKINDQYAAFRDCPQPPICRPN